MVILAALLGLNPTVADLTQILHNGDSGTRHVIETELPSNWRTEFYAEPGKALVISSFGGRQFWSEGTQTTVFQSRAAEVQRTKKEQTLWFEYSVKAVGRWVTDGKNLVLSVERSIPFDGAIVDRYTIDLDPNVGNTPAPPSLPEPTHAILTVDSATQRPMDIRIDRNGHPSQEVKWDYSPMDPKVFKLPPLDMRRLYDRDHDIDILRRIAHVAGPVARVAGAKVELLQLWKDDSGSAVAIAATTYPPTKEGRVTDDGTGVQFDYGSDGGESRRTASMGGRALEAFYSKEDQEHMPTKVERGRKGFSVAIPVYMRKRLLGFARFRGVPLHRTYQIGALLQDRRSPFWQEMVSF